MLELRKDCPVCGEPLRVAVYARVSSDRQEHEQTIQSQLAEPRARLHQEGMVDW